MQNKRDISLTTYLHFAIFLTIFHVLPVYAKDDVANNICPQDLLAHSTATQPQPAPPPQPATTHTQLTGAQPQPPTHDVQAAPTTDEPQGPTITLSKDLRAKLQAKGVRPEELVAMARDWHGIIVNAHIDGGPKDWTMLFASGRVLAHLGVSRDAGFAAVVENGIATKLIDDGQAEYAFTA